MIVQGWLRPNTAIWTREMHLGHKFLLSNYPTIPMLWRVDLPGHLIVEKVAVFVQGVVAMAFPHG